MPRAARKRTGLIRLLLLALFLLALALGYRVAAASDYFKVTQVEVRGDESGLVTEDIRSTALGRNLIFFPEKELQEKVGTNLLVREVSLSKVFPAKLIAQVSWREPYLSWQTRAGRFLVDRSGIAYASAQAEPVPQISDSSTELTLGQLIPKNKFRLIERVLEVAQGKFTVLTAAVSDDEVTVTLSSNIQVIFSGKSDLDQSSHALQLLLAKAKIDGKIPRLIDLRYQKPVVSY